MPKPDVSELRTKQIIEAAIAVFSEKGFHSARMEDIGDAAGVSKATIYLYFKDKDALIKTIANEVFRHEVAELEAARRLPGTTADKLQALMTSFVVREEEVEALMPIAHEFYALSSRRPGVQQILSHHLGVLVDSIKAILQQGIEQGEFPAIDTEKTALTFIALLEGTLAQELYLPEAKDTAAQLQYGVNLLLKGLQK